MRCLIPLLAFTASCFATSIGQRFYVSRLPQTYSDSTIDSVAVHIDEALLYRLNATLILGRQERLEQAACLRVARIDSHGIWLDSMLTAAVDPSMTTVRQISFTCNNDAVPYHAHVVFVRDGWDQQCELSAPDRAPILSAFPAELMQCGIGPDSITAYRVRKR